MNFEKRSKGQVDNRELGNIEDESKREFLQKLPAFLAFLVSPNFDIFSDGHIEGIESGPTFKKLKEKYYELIDEAKKIVKSELSGTGFFDLFDKQKFSILKKELENKEKTDLLFKYIIYYSFEFKENYDIQVDESGEINGNNKLKSTFVYGNLHHDLRSQGYSLSERDVFGMVFVSDFLKWLYEQDKINEFTSGISVAGFSLSDRVERDINNFFKDLDKYKPEARHDMLVLKVGSKGNTFLFEKAGRRKKYINTLSNFVRSLMDYE